MSFFRFSESKYQEYIRNALKIKWWFFSPAESIYRVTETISDPESPCSLQLPLTSCFLCHMLCSGISSFWHLVFRRRENYFQWTREITIRKKWLKFPGSYEWDVFLSVPEQLSLGRKPKKVRAFNPSVSPKWTWNISYFSGPVSTGFSSQMAALSHWTCNE